MAFDTARHLAIKGRYFSWMAYPDRWISWMLGAVPSGLCVVYRHRPSVIWSTFPIGTAHLVGLALHKLTGIPWVADFRDPMTEGELGSADQHPTDAATWKVRRWFERLIVRNCTKLVFVAPGALRMYQERYPEIPSSRWHLITNGYDETSFRAAEQRSLRNPQGPLLLLHSGLLYPEVGDRNPSALFEALSILRNAGKIDAASLKVVLRASGHDDLYRELIREWKLDDMVFLEPPISYIDALAEMLAADGLLLVQGAVSNPNIPAKLYEYLRARRPIFALTDEKGDTAAVLRNAKVGTLAPLESCAAIGRALEQFLAEVREGRAPVASNEEIAKYSRESQVRDMARLFDEVAGDPPSTEACRG
ncbi:MAG: hypothetical protein NW202_14955 [Nitrospira sp.]|nr:hypothetical protein [Nitrospira sp.]